MSDQLWFLLTQEERLGPMKTEDLLQRLYSLPTPRETLIWRKGSPDWRKAGEVPEIAEELPPPHPVGVPVKAEAGDVLTTNQTEGRAEAPEVLLREAPQPIPTRGKGSVGSNGTLVVRLRQPKGWLLTEVKLLVSRPLSSTGVSAWPSVTESQAAPGTEIPFVAKLDYEWARREVKWEVLQALGLPDEVGLSEIPRPGKPTQSPSGSQAATTAPAPTGEWYINTNGTVHGPLTRSEVIDGLRSGRFPPDLKLRHGGETIWRQAKLMDEFAALASASTGGWYVRTGGAVHGPLTKREVADGLRSGRFPPSSKLKQGAERTWRQAKLMEEFAALELPDTLGSIDESSSLFSLSGRIPRSQFARIMIGLHIISFVFLLFMLLVENSPELREFGTGIAVLLYCYLALTIPMTLCAGVRRLHDLGHSGWFMILAFLPFVNAVLFLYLLFAPGTPLGTTGRV